MSDGPGYATEQERFWAGEFGDDYQDRNRDGALVESNVAMFRKILARTDSVESVLELGANLGLNLMALHEILPEARLVGLEINRAAVDKLAQLPYVSARQGSLLEVRPEESYDLVFTKGVLIHIAPERLKHAYETLVASSRRYVCVAEYYSPRPVEVPYRGHRNRLFKRDFAGELLEGWGLSLVDYGFVYHRDPSHPQDDLNWFLLEKE